MAKKHEAQKKPLLETPESLGSVVPEDVRKTYVEKKKVLESFSLKVVEKFSDYVMGIALLPPPPKKPEEQKPANELHMLILVDDTDSHKMPKNELATKLFAIIDQIGKEVDPEIKPQPVLLSELWQSCYDAKYDLLQVVAMSAPVHDKGMLQAIRIAEVHRSMVLKKFEKYIVSYVLAGSLTQGRATKKSDIDVWIVIDDTDVKKMTRVELKDKLRAIIIGMGIEAGEYTSVKNKINIQVYILTEFWDSLREANPVIFTLLRDGVPFYDRGIFMPWKQLLRQGKIKPSPEAIDMFMGSGFDLLKRVEAKIREIGIEDVYYAILTPSQAALMLYGIAPPAPKETAELMKEIFVRKERMLEEKWVKVLEKSIDVRKDIEHGTKKDLTGMELDRLVSDAKEYLKRIKELFAQIEARRDEEDMVHLYESAQTVIRDALVTQDIKESKEEELLAVMEKSLVNTGKVPASCLRAFGAIVKAKKDYDAKKLTKVEVEKVRRESRDFFRILVEFMQRSRGRELERAKIRVKYGEKFGEVLLLDNVAFIIEDIDAQEKAVQTALLKEDGSLGAVKKSSLEELEKHLASFKLQNRVFIKQPIFEDLKKIFGKDVEVLVSW